jgi:putative transposase
METSIRITPGERQALREQYRKSRDPQMRLRAHIVLLLAQGYSWAVIASVLFCSTRPLARWKTRVTQEGVAAVLAAPLRPQPQFAGWWSEIVACWVRELTPRHFGFLRSRWCCGTIVLLLLDSYHLQVSPETVRRWLHREQVVWRRPRPVVGPRDPEREALLQALRQRLALLPANEIAVFQDGGAVNTNPLIGAMGMRRGQQALIPTPGSNEKRSLAGSLHWRTGALRVTEGRPKEGRSGALSATWTSCAVGCCVTARSP